MSLSPEDSLRLNVLLANKPLAIRIDESRMCVHALTEIGENKITLHANCKDEKYIKLIKELLSGEIMNSPGGYPIFIQRWTRMGQMNDESLAELLLLGEPEAVVAAAYAPGLTDELCRRAWWAMDDAENAREMLTHKAVVEGKMGTILASYLIEFLPFETEASQMMKTIRLVLQPGLIEEDIKQSLWKKAKRKTAFYLGFLSAIPDELPEVAKQNTLYDEYKKQLSQLSKSGNEIATLLLRVYSQQGQAWLGTMLSVFTKAVNQDVINEALDIIAEYFTLARSDGMVDLTIEELIQESEEWVSNLQVTDVDEIRSLSSVFIDDLKAMRILSGMSYGVVRPVFCDSTAIGSLMRRKIEPIVASMSAEFNQLLSK